MKLTEAQAKDIAIKFAKAEDKSFDFPLNYDSVSAVFYQNLPRETYLNVKNEYWSIIIPFTFSSSELATMDPDHINVIVDAKNGDAECCPVL